MEIKKQGPQADPGMRSKKGVSLGGLLRRKAASTHTRLLSHFPVKETPARGRIDASPVVAAPQQEDTFTCGAEHLIWH